MRYIATCPDCATPVSRVAYFRPHRRCARCRAPIKPVGKWTAFDWVASALFMLMLWAALASLLVAGIAVGLLSLLAVSLAYLGVGWLTFPYITRFGRSDATCAKCGYDLRASPLRCPECGTPVDGKARPAPGRPLDNQKPETRNQKSESKTNDRNSE